MDDIEICFKNIYDILHIPYPSKKDTVLYKALEELSEKVATLLGKIFLSEPWNDLSIRNEINLVDSE